VIICGNHYLTKQHKINISLLLCKKDIYASLREFCSPVHAGGVYANRSFARDAEKQKNKLADDGGGLTTMFFTHCFTAVHRPLFLTVGSAVWCGGGAKPPPPRTLSFTFPFTFPINITIYIRFQLVNLWFLFGFSLVIDWLLLGYCSVSVWLFAWFLFASCLVSQKNAMDCNNNP